MSQSQHKKDNVRSGDRTHLLVNKNASSIGKRVMQTEDAGILCFQIKIIICLERMVSPNNNTKKWMDFEYLSKITSTGRKMGGGIFFTWLIICRIFRVVKREKIITPNSLCTRKGISPNSVI